MNTKRTWNKSYFPPMMTTGTGSGSVRAKSCEKQVFFKKTEWALVLDTSNRKHVTGRKITGWSSPSLFAVSPSKVPSRSGFCANSAFTRVRISLMRNSVVIQSFFGCDKSSINTMQRLERFFACNGVSSSLTNPEPPCKSQIWQTSFVELACK